MSSVADICLAMFKIHFLVIPLATRTRMVSTQSQRVPLPVHSNRTEYGGGWDPCQALARMVVNIYCQAKFSCG